MRQIYGYEKFLGKSLLKYKTDKVGRFRERKDLSYNKNLLNRYLEKQHRSGLSNLLYYGDIVAMANSVENRSPFMDHRLVEYAFSCDESLKVKDGMNKAVLRDSEHYLAFKKYLERKKVGFNSPLSDDLKRSMVNDLSSSELISNNILDRNVFSKFISNKEFYFQNGKVLFRIYQVHLWWDIFICKEKNRE